MEILKRLKDLDVNPIHLENKYGCKEVDAILRKCNDLLYMFNLLYITESARLYLLDQIESFGKELNNVSQSMAKVSSSRKDELRKKLVDVYKKIRAYYPELSENDVNCISIVGKMNSMLTGQFLKEKKEKGLSDEMVFEWLKKIKTFSKCYDLSNNLKGVNIECLKWFSVYDG